MDYELLRFGMSALYDYQDTRCSLNNRMRSLIRTKYLGLPSFTVERKMEDEDKSKGEFEDKSLPELIALAKTQGKLTEGDERLLSNLQEISKYSEEMEEKYQKWIEPEVVKEAIWTEWLSKVKGIGPRLTANLLYFYGYGENYEKISNLWAYSGYHVIDGHAPKRKHGEKMNWNMKAKTLGFKIGDSFIKQNGVYKKIYDEAKVEYMNRKDLQEMHKCKKCDGTGKLREKDCAICKGRGFTVLHMHRMAMRKMIKIFLEHYWVTARKLKGLPISDPYILGKDKHEHYIEPMTDE